MSSRLFALEQSGQLLAAGGSHAGFGLEALPVDFTVEVGSPTAGRDHSGCGVRQNYALTFSGDNVAEVEVGSSAPFTVGGLRYLAYNVETWLLEASNCSDAGNPQEWLVVLDPG